MLLTTLVVCQKSTEYLRKRKDEQKSQNRLSLFSYKRKPKGK